FLAQLKMWLLKQPEVGAALMSGSGSTVFAVLRDRADVDHLARRAKVELDPEIWTCACEARERVLGSAVARLFIAAAGRDAPHSAGSLRESCCRQVAGNNRLVACAPRSTRQRAKLFAELFAELRARVFAVELRDETGADLGGTHRFAFVSIRAVAEFFCVHRAHHFQNAALAFRLSLRQRR